MHAKVGIVRHGIEIGIDPFGKQARIRDVVASFGKTFRECRIELRPQVGKDVVLVEDTPNVGDDRLGIDLRGSC